ncbi:3-[(3aS,4S,7aS)-7a-methyl-1,5-dioxo-octahydro-1H-inden-4-yl]propanoyl:CoA ligase-like [Amphiura filiformis]|uniref:3-[(3aS,4S,7aS)-7a-methyl-1, 5-dioxo-octahydro-1H-inden-4-yl]propanoyl:CoA ligase-like n=1 Tax=Amphiura filiformis TaxID=82378 RepID=UPI003B222281
MFIHHLSDLVHLPNLQSYDLSSLKAICVTGSIIPSTLRRKLKQLAPFVTNQYGATEMLGIHLSHPLDPAYVLDSAAVYPTGGIEVKIVDQKGETVPIDTRGEICIRGYAVFKYYWMDEKLTKDAKDENGWWHTRDLGIMDDKGYFRVLGRNTDLIVIKEAINVAPLELEAVLYEHEAVADALVVGVPDERSFEEVCACIKLNKEKPVTVNGDDI